MLFNASLSTTDGVATIELSGHLDAASAPVFQQEIENAAGHQPRALVLLMADLDYMASAGLRGLIFAKQKMGAGVVVMVVAAQPQVMDVIRATGFDRSVMLMDRYDPTAIAEA
jgi:anti-sigma B factor antagonist